MLAEYFGFRCVPFSKEIPTAHLYPATQHQELLARLQYTVGALELVFPSASDLRGFLTHARTAFAQARRRARAQRVGDRARSTVYQARFL